MLSVLSVIPFLALRERPAVAKLRMNWYNPSSPHSTHVSLTHHQHSECLAMETELPIWEIALRLSVAAVLGALIGFEREMKDRPAGLTTHMLVSLGAAAFMLVGYEILFATAVGDPSAKIDPTRIVQGVITGIGFLGAGSIIQSGASVRGLTTGAAIWIAGAIGVSCAIGNFILAVLLTTMALTVIVVMGQIEKKYVPNDND